MTQTQFKSLPYLLLEHHILELGHSRSTVMKWVDCGVLARVQPPGCQQARYQKKQVAQLLRWEHLLEPDRFKAERPMMPLKSVQTWTGFGRGTLEKIVASEGLQFVLPAGSKQGRFLKSEIAKLIGLEYCL